MLSLFCYARSSLWLAKLRAQVFFSLMHLLPATQVIRKTYVVSYQAPLLVLSKAFFSILPLLLSFKRRVHNFTFVGQGRRPPLSRVEASDRVHRRRARTQVNERVMGGVSTLLTWLLGCKKKVCTRIQD